jgi:hypothetical protein
MAKAVNINIETWYFVIVFSFVFYFISLAVNLAASLNEHGLCMCTGPLYFVLSRGIPSFGSLFQTLAITWTLLGYLAFACNVYFEIYLIQLRNAFTPLVNGKQSRSACGTSPNNSVGSSNKRQDYPRRGELVTVQQQQSDDAQIMSSEGDVREDDEETIQLMLDTVAKKGYLSTLTLHEKIDPTSLLAWCTVDAHQRGSRTASKTNHHEKLFWGGKNGVNVHIIALQLNLVFTGVYNAFQIIVFLPVMWAKSCHWDIFVPYLVISVLPILGLVYNKSSLVSTLSLVGSVGCHRAHQVASSVLREEKTARAVRSIVVIYSLYNAVNEPNLPRNSSSVADLNDSMISQPPRAHSHFGLLQLSNIFDTFDASGDGSLSHEELRLVFRSLPGEVSHAQIDHIIAMLDDDGSCDISRA